jgi:hypothetical protein
MFADAEAGWLLTKIERSKVPQETSLLLVDFNLGEDLEDKKDEKRIERTVSCVSILILDLRSLPFLPGYTYLYLTSC